MGYASPRRQAAIRDFEAFLCLLKARLASYPIFYIGIERKALAHRPQMGYDKVILSF
jgi:hypothetical protein